MSIPLFGYEKGPAETRGLVLTSALLNEETQLHSFVSICCLSPLTLEALWKGLWFIMCLFSVCSTAWLLPTLRASKRYCNTDTFLKKQFSSENGNNKSAFLNMCEMTNTLGESGKER